MCFSASLHLLVGLSVDLHVEGHLPWSRHGKRSDMSPPSHPAVKLILHLSQRVPWAVRGRGKTGKKQLLPRAGLVKKAGNRSLKEQMTLTRDTRVKCVLGGWDTRAKGWRHSYSRCVPQAQQSWCGNQCQRQTNQASARAVNQREVLGAAPGDLQSLSSEEGETPELGFP